jgi:signal peptidase I
MWAAPGGGGRRSDQADWKPQGGVIPEGHYFVMGDNRDDSRDARYWGLVPRRNIVGRAVGVIVSLDIENSYKPRWDRFFMGLD